MVTLDVRHRDEAEATVEAPEPMDIAIDASNVMNQGHGEKSNWSYSVPFPGVRYYSFDRARPVKAPGKAADGI